MHVVSVHKKGSAKSLAMTVAGYKSIKSVMGDVLRLALPLYQEEGEESLLEYIDSYMDELMSLYGEKTEICADTSINISISGGTMCGFEGNKIVKTNKNVSKSLYDLFEILRKKFFKMLAFPRKFLYNPKCCDIDSVEA